MKLSVLDIIQKASAELGLTQPTSVVSSTDTTTIQLNGLLNALGEELLTYDWTPLQTEYVFTTVAGQDTYSLPNDFLRIINHTEWNRSSAQPLSGPQRPDQWQQLKSGISTTIQYSFRIKGDKLIVFPVPTAEENLSLEYISAAYVIDGTTGQFKLFATQDSDKFIFGDRLMINGLKMKFKEAQGLETQFAAFDFNAVLDAERSGDGGAAVLSLNYAPTSYTNIPDGNWNQ